MKIECIAENLLKRVYQPVTAVVSMDKESRIVGVILFDTLFGTEDRVICTEAVQVAVILGHPDGSIEISEEEERNIRRILQEAAGRKIGVSVYISGEDIGCFPVDREDICSYNEENAV